MNLNKLVFLAAIFLALFPYVGDNDFWFHLRTGEIIIEENHFPKTDILSFTGEGKEWINHEWLPQSVFYLLFDLGGYLSIAIFAAIAGAALFALLLYNRQLSWPLIAFLFLVAYSLKPFIVPRPQIFAYLLLLVLVLAIERKKFVFIPIILFIWANVHASIILALPILFAALFFEKDKRFLLFSLLGIALTLINPFVYKIYWHALQPLRFSEAYHQLLETRPIYQVFSSFPHLLVVHLFIIFIAVKNFKILNFKLLILFLVMPFVAVKYLPFSWLAVLPMIIKAFPQNRNKFFKNLALSVVLVIAAILFVRENNFLKDPHIEWPKEMLSFIKEHEIQGNTYHSYGWGGYIAWENKRPIFINVATADLGGQAFWDGVDFEKAERTDEIIEKHNLSVITAPPWMPLPYAISLKNDWVLVYWDNFGVVFARRGYGNDEVIDKYSLDIKYFNDSVESVLKKYDPKKIPELVQNYEKAISRQPDLLLARYRLGLIYQLSGECPKAIEEYQKLLEINYKLGSAHFRLAECYQKTGEFKLAAAEESLGEKFVKKERWWKGRR